MEHSFLIYSAGARGGNVACGKACMRTAHTNAPAPLSCKQGAAAETQYRPPSRQQQSHTGGGKGRGACVALGAAAAGPLPGLAWACDQQPATPARLTNTLSSGAERTLR